MADVVPLILLLTSIIDCLISNQDFFAEGMANW